jgi:pSer/pThr/pTyr-binding forkhead associated (FHA) protein
LPSLIVIQGPDRGRRIDLAGERLLVGRDQQCDVRLHDTEVSRRHAEFRLADESAEIVDLGSSNGTYLNGQRITRHKVEHGDRLLLGRTEMLVARLKNPRHAEEQAPIIDLIPRTSTAGGSAFFHSIKSTEGSQVFHRAEQTGNLWLRDALINLSVLYDASQAVSRIGDVDELLKHMMQLTFRSVSADRGCMVLRDLETGKWRA